MLAENPVTRVLAVLELLQSRERWGGQELAARLGVARRTVRRYIASLEALGIPITTERGSLGGYSLVSGYKLPPMTFTNDEALGIGLGLTAVRGLGLTSTQPAVASAQAKLERVMPAPVRERLRSVSESVAFARPFAPTAVESGPLQTLSVHASRRQGVRLSYRAPRGDHTQRDFDAYGVAFSGGHWYVAGYCHLRRGLRTFRLDRVTEVTAQPRAFERPAHFDVLEHLITSIATLPRKFSLEVVLDTDLDTARRELFPAIGIFEPRADGVLVRSQTDDLMWFARELSRVPFPFRILRPLALRTALKCHAKVLLGQAETQTRIRS